VARFRSGGREKPAIDRGAGWRAGCCGGAMVFTARSTGDRTGARERSDGSFKETGEGVKVGKKPIPSCRGNRVTTSGVCRAPSHGSVEGAAEVEVWGAAISDELLSLREAGRQNSAGVVKVLRDSGSRGGCTRLLKTGNQNRKRARLSETGQTGGACLAKRQRKAGSCFATLSRRRTPLPRARHLRATPRGPSAPRALHHTRRSIHIGPAGVCPSSPPVARSRGSQLAEGRA
jgi:hypothetical protein